MSIEGGGHTVSRRLGRGRIDCRKTGCQQNICINIHMACSLHGYLKLGHIAIALAGISETLDLITRARMQQLRARQRPRLRSAIEECGFTYKLNSIHKDSELPSKPMFDSDRPLLVMRGWLKHVGSSFSQPVWMTLCEA